MAKKKPDCTETQRTLAEIALHIGARPGMDTVRKITTEMQSRLPDVKYEEVVEAIVAASESAVWNMNDTQRQLAAIRREARAFESTREKADVQEAYNEIALATGDLEAALLQISEPDATRQAVEEVQAQKKRLARAKRVAELRKEISDIDLAIRRREPREKRKKADRGPVDPVVEKLERERKVKMRSLKRILREDRLGRRKHITRAVVGRGDRNAPLARAAREASRFQRRAEKAARGLREVVADLQRHLLDGTLPPKKGRKLKPTTEEVKDLRVLRDRLRTALRNSPQAVKERLEASVKAAEEKLAKIEAGGYVAPVPVDRITGHPELEQLAYERARTRRKIDRALEDLRPQTMFQQLAEPFNLARSVMTSADLSATLRQGGFFSLSNPQIAYKSFVPMVEALFSEKRADEIMAEIENRDNAMLYRRYGLFIAPLDSDSADLTSYEEAYMSRLLNWFTEKAPVIGPLVAGSQRAYVTFLNKLRADAFDALKESLAKDGELTAEEGAALASFVNIATGRGSLGKMEGAAYALNTAFFAPKYVASRFQLLAGAVAPGKVYGEGSARVRNLIRRQYAQYGLALALVYGLAHLAFGDEEDFSIEFDARSSDFGKLRFGNTRVDPLSGLGQVMVLGTRVGTGQVKDTKIGRIKDLRGPDKPFGVAGTAGVMGRFVWTKLSPMAGTAVDLAQGETVVGEPVTFFHKPEEFSFDAIVGMPGTVPKNLLMPLSFSEIGNAIDDQGLRGVFVSAAAVLGTGAQVYGERAKDNEAALGKLVYDLTGPNSDPRDEEWELLSKFSATEIILATRKRAHDQASKRGRRFANLRSKPFQDRMDRLRRGLARVRASR